ncbi:MAG: dephospho-CoA kinase [Candidatus Hydrogenedentes bacterium]|nr:dephospho-CoA kinase [Candidatus Hydrogenedentota bacterium]
MRGIVESEMKIYGLTGGIGSGKSEAARQFAARGIPVIDADAIGHAVIAPGGAAVEHVINAFGSGVLTDGIIDRKKVGARVFSDPEALARLNALVHPMIYAEVMKRCAVLAEEGHGVVIIEAALLAENGAKEPFLAGLIVVTSPAAVRIERLVSSRGMSRTEAEQRIAAQAPPERKAAFANWVVENDGTIEQLRARIDRIAHEIDHGQDPD